MSSRTGGEAVAVSAMIRRLLERVQQARPAGGSPGRKSWPHDDTQCASSTATKVGRIAVTAARTSSLASCSGARYRNSTRPAAASVERLVPFALGLRGADPAGYGLPPVRLQPRRLVLLQGQQRRHDHGRPVQQHRRQLVGQRLPAAGGLHEQHVVPVQQRPTASRWPGRSRSWPKTVRAVSAI